MMTTLERVVFNLAGPYRRETHNGREYFVAPMVMAPHGVMHGSKGPLYYPEEEYGRTVNSWDGVPLTDGHPTHPMTSEPLSAYDHGVYERIGMGLVKNPTYNDGKLRAEAWFDAERTKTVNRRIYDALDSGKQIGVSTGLHTDNDPTPGVYNNTPYVAVARNHRPDHLAVLIDQVGACSLDQGCGVGVVNCGGEGGTKGPCPHEMTKREYVAMKTAEPGQSGMSRFHAQMHKNHVAAAVADSKMTVEKGKKHYKDIEEHPVVRAAIKAGKIQGELKYGPKAGDIVPNSAVPSDDIDSDKACQILHDGTAQGHELTEAQRRMFGAACGGKTTDNAWTDAAREASAAARKRAAPKGQGIAMGQVESQEAIKASKQAGKTDTPEAHDVAAKAHGAASKAHGAAYDRFHQVYDEGHTGMGTGKQTIRAEHHAAREAHRAAAEAHQIRVDELRRSTTNVRQSFLEWVGGLLGLTENTPQHPVSGRFHPPATMVHAHVEKGAKDAGVVPPKKGDEEDDEVDNDCASKTVANESDEEGKQLIASVSNNQRGEAMKLNADDRKKLVDELVTNCACQTANVWTEQDRELLNNMTDERLAGLVRQRLAVVNADPADDDEEEPDEDDKDKKPMFGKKKPTGNAVTNAGQLVTNTVPVAHSLTDAEWLAAAPASIRETLNYAAEVESNAKQAIVRQLVANVADPKQRQALGDKYIRRPLSELRELQALIPAPRIDNSLPTYIGAGGFNPPEPSYVDNAADDVLPIMTMRDLIVNEKSA